LSKEKRVKKGEIWRVDLGNNTVEHEQQGKRPAVIVANISSSNLATIILMTSNKSRMKFAYVCTIKDCEKSKIGYDGFALIYQIRTVSKKRLEEKVGEVSNEELKKIEEQMKIMFGFDMG